MFERDEVVTILEKAFLPLLCKAELYDFEHAIRFRVYDVDGRPLLRVNDDKKYPLSAELLQDAEYLEGIIRGVRGHLGRYRHLPPWQAPRPGTL